MQTRCRVIVDTYIELQNAVIKEYGIELCDGSKCNAEKGARADWRRTHAHVQKKRVCKWQASNSVKSTFTLLHEIGHIIGCKGKGNLRRCEDEYYATLWAMDQCDRWMLIIPQTLLVAYQTYIDREHARGLRRGGRLPSLNNLQLKNSPLYETITSTLKY